MNTEFTSDFAKQFAANPSLFGANREAMLVELITSFVEGSLPSPDAEEIAALVRSNARAKTIHDNILAANQFLDSQKGQEWLDKPLVPTISSVLRLLDAPSGDTAKVTSPPSAASRFKGLLLVISEYRSTHRRTIAKVAGEALVIQDFSNPAGYPLQTGDGEVRFYCNLREHNGTTDIVFALRLPDAASPVSIRWERHFADTGKPPKVRVLKFTSDAFRLEFPGMERPDESERWSFECIDTGGAS